MGRKADAIGAGVRRHEHESHVVIYEEDADGVLILAIVHGASVRRLGLP
jgi:toxin ParE1/3/4